MPQLLIRRFVFIVVIVNGLLFVAHLFIISQSLSDGNHINPNVNASQWQANGVRVTVLDSQRNQLLDGDIVIAVEGRPLGHWVDRLYCRGSDCSPPTSPELVAGTVLSYTVLRDGKPQMVQATLRPYPFWEVISRSWGALTFPILSYLIFLALFIKRPEEDSVIALVLAASGLLGSMGWAFGQDVVGILNGHSFWLYRFATEIIYWPSVFGVLHFALTFPKPLPFIKQRRWILWAIYLTGYLFYGLAVLLSTQLTSNKLLWMAYNFNAQSIIVTPYYLCAFLGLFFNFRTLTAEKDRQQIRIVALTSGLVLLLSLVARSLPSALFGVSFVASNEMAVLATIVPLSIVFAILRNRLWNIDIIINRTLVFTGVSATIVGLYIILVAVIGRVLQTGTDLPTSIVATGIVAVMFQPIRLRLQNFVNRAMYGERDDPTAVLTQLAQQLEIGEAPAEILPNLVQTIAHTLKIPHVAIWLPVSENKFEPVVKWGEAAEHVEMLALTYQKEAIGQLAVARRSQNEPFTRQEEQLLHTIAALTANTVRAVQLSNELRHSRQRIVSAREEERRRLRRDLHDGLGPQLASQTLGLEAVAQLLTVNPEKAHELLGSLKIQAHEAITDVRRLVYDLRPPTLDDLGLIGAIQQIAERYETAALQITVEVPEPLLELPAAVETAAYRITQEALTNIVRHAQATRGTVRLTCTNHELMVEIEDNGRGLPSAHRSGIGLHSMRERSAELNGRCMIEVRPQGGTTVKAHLPLEVIYE